MDLYVKKNVWILIFIFIGFLQCNAQNDSISQSFIVYTDSVSHVFVHNKPVNVELKSHIKKSTFSTSEILSRKGMIIASYDENYFMTDGVKHCLKLAMDTWEDKLVLNKPIGFYVCVSENMDSEIAINTTVGYSRSNNLAYADNLLNQSTVSDVPLRDTIRVNAYVDWNTSWSYDDTYDGTVNLTNGFMRNIARILGFGCSVVERIGGVNFVINRCPSTFDQFVYSGSTCLASLARQGRPDFDRFFSQDTKLKFDSFILDLYDSGQYEKNKSGLYFSLGFDNLMEYPFHYQIDPQPLNIETLFVMKNIGWNIGETDNEILCDSTDALGYGTIYGNYVFSLKNPQEGAADDMRWSYQVFDNVTKSYSTVHTATGNRFYLTPIVEDSSIDEFQCHQARIVSEYNGKHYSFPLSLETRPLIKGIEVTNYIQTDERHYKINLNVYQLGATSGYIMVSDDTGSTREYNYNNGTITVSNLQIGQTIYIDVTLENEHGSANSFIELSSQLTSRCMKQIPSNIKIKSNCNISNYLHDADRVTFTLPDWTDDSMLFSWYMDIGGVSKQIYPESINNNTYTYTISTEYLDLKMHKTIDKDIVRFEGGKSWGNISWDGEANCSFNCYANNSSEMEITRLAYRSKKYVFDVLPSCPTLEIVDSWIEEVDNYPWIKVKIHPIVNNAASLGLVVAQSDFYGTEYIDTVIENNLQDEFVTKIALADDDLSCIAINEYGSNRGPRVKINTTDIADVPTDNSGVNVIGNRITIPSTIKSFAFVYSASGVLVKTLNQMQNDIQLEKGMYIVKYIDNNKSVIRKIKIN